MQISQANFDILFLIMIWMSIGGLIAIPIVWSLLTFLTPKKLLDTYFKEPHFSPAELIFMRHYPGIYVRTSIFGTVMILPFLDKKRKIRDSHKVMPLWYKIPLKAFSLFMMLFIVTFFGILLFLSSVDIVKS